MQYGVLVYTTFDPTDNHPYLAIGDITGELWRERNDDLGYALAPDGSLLTIEHGTLTHYQRRDNYQEGVVLLRPPGGKGDLLQRPHQRGNPGSLPAGGGSVSDQV